MSDANETIILAYLKASWNTGLYTLVRNFLSPDFRYKTAFSEEILNLDKYIEFIRAFRKAMPDLEIHVDEIMSKGNKVVTNKSFDGVVEESFFGIPASEKIITFPVASIWTLEDGKITGLNTLMDISGIERQLKTKLHPEKPLTERA